MSSGNVDQVISRVLLGQRVAHTTPFNGLKYGIVLDTHDENPSVPAGGMRFIIPALTGRDPWGPVPYPGSVAPPINTRMLLGWDDVNNRPMVVAFLNWQGGKTLLRTAAPTSGDGDIGDIWMDTTHSLIYGPKTVSGWGAGVNFASGGVSGVSSFNTRTGAVVLSKADVTGTGLAAADVGAVPTSRQVLTSPRLSGGGDLSADRTIDLASGVATPGTYPKVTVDTYGRVTAGSSLVAGDIPNIAESQVTNLSTDLAAKAPVASPTFTGVATSPVWATTGITGATAGSRHAGGTTTGAPSSGTFLLGDYIVAQNGHIWVCTVAGSPGTWIDAGAAGAPVSSVFGRTGAVTAQTGDYAVAQVTGAAPLASPALTGAPTAPTPTTSSGIATKGYVDSVAQGLSPKPSVVACASSNQTLSGLPTVDGVTLTANQRILLIGQSTGSQNGIWQVAVGAWSRPTDFATGATGDGAFTFVESGTTYGSSGFVLAGVNVTIDTTSETWTQFSGAGEITAGTGITKTGNILSLTSGIVAPGTYPKVTVDTYGRVTAGASLASTDLPSGVATPGTYPKVTVDTYGRVTGGTTLSSSDIPTSTPILGDATGTLAASTVGKIQNIAVSSAAASIVSGLAGAVTRNTSSLPLAFAAGEGTILTGSTTNKTGTLPTTPTVSTVNTIANYSSVPVTIAAGGADTISNQGVAGSIVLMPNQIMQLAYIGTTWYAIDNNAWSSLTSTPQLLMPQFRKATFAGHSYTNPENGVGEQIPFFNPVVITNIVVAAGVATVTTATSHLAQTGMYVLIAQAGNAGFNGLMGAITYVSSTSFTFSTAVANGTYNGGYVQPTLNDYNVESSLAARLMTVLGVDRFDVNWIGVAGSQLMVDSYNAGGATNYGGWQTVLQRVNQIGTRAPSTSESGFCVGVWGINDVRRLTPAGYAVWNGYGQSVASAAITAASWASNVATYTSNGHGLAVGQVVTVAGMTPSGYNTTGVVTSVATNTFTLVLTTNPGTATVFGTWSLSVALAAYAHSMRTVISRFRSAAVFEDTDTSIAFSGVTGFGGMFGTSSTLSSGTGWTRMGNSAVATITVPSWYDGGPIAIGLLSIGGGGTVSISIDSGAVTCKINGVTTSTVKTGALSYDGSVVPLCLRLVDNNGNSVMAAGAHTITVTVTAVDATPSAATLNNATYTAASGSIKAYNTYTTTAAHGFIPGDFVTVAGVTTGAGTNNFNISGFVTMATATTFQIVAPTASTGAYTSGGTGTYGRPVATNTAAAWASGVATITATNTFSAGDIVTISGSTASSGANLNGTYVVASATGSAYTIAMSSTFGTITAYGTTTVQRGKVDFDYWQIEGVSPNPVAMCQIPRLQSYVGATYYDYGVQIFNQVIGGTLAINDQYGVSIGTGILEFQGPTFAPAWQDLLYQNPGNFASDLTHPSELGSRLLSDSLRTAVTAYMGSKPTATITNVGTSGGVATFTAANTFKVGDLVVVSGMTPTSYNGTYLVSAASSTTFSVVSSGSGAFSVGGIATLTNQVVGWSSPAQLNSTLPPIPSAPDGTEYSGAAGGYVFPRGPSYPRGAQQSLSSVVASSVSTAHSISAVLTANPAGGSLRFNFSAAHGFLPGDVINVQGFTDDGTNFQSRYNGVYIVRTIPNNSSVTVSSSMSQGSTFGSPVASLVGGKTFAAAGPHGFVVGDTVVISGATDTDWNIATVISSVPDTSHFEVRSPISGVTLSGAIATVGTVMPWVQNRLYLIPVFLPRGPVEINSLSIFNQVYPAPSAGTVRWGVYTDHKGWPSDLIVDLGTSTATSPYLGGFNGFGPILGPSFTKGYGPRIRRPGVYWLGVVAQGLTGTLYTTCMTGQNPLVASFASYSLGNVALAVDTWLGNAISGALPTSFLGTFGGLGFANIGGIGVTQAPVVEVQLQATQGDV